MPMYTGPGGRRKGREGVRGGERGRWEFQAGDVTIVEDHVLGMV